MESFRVSAYGQGGPLRIEVALAIESGEHIYRQLSLEDLRIWQAKLKTAEEHLLRRIQEEHLRQLKIQGLTP